MKYVFPKSAGEREGLHQVDWIGNQPLRCGSWGLEHSSSLTSTQVQPVALMTLKENQHTAVLNREWKVKQTNSEELLQQLGAVKVYDPSAVSAV